MNKQNRGVVFVHTAVLLAGMGFIGAALGQSSPQAQAAPASPAAAPSLYATVNDKQITQAEFHATFSNFLRQKFYHGQIPADQVMAARKEVEDQIVSRLLLLEEIDRRGVQPDGEEVERQVTMYDKRYAGNPSWEKSRESVLPGLREQLKLQSRLAKLEQTVRNVKAPGEDEVRAFYSSRQDLFTEPEKLRVRIILLAVDPSSPRQAWDAAASEAASIVKRIRAGADFGEQARLSSNDATAEKGGDMGYIHRGMLPDLAHQKIDAVKVGEITDPIESLQGMVILKLEDRTPAAIQPFDRVAERARDLVLRERKDKAWTDYLAGLRAAAKIVILAPLGSAGGTASAPAAAPAK